MEEGRQYAMNPDVYRAAFTGNSSFFETLTGSSSTLLQVTIEKNTVLHVALQFEQFHIVEKLVRLRPSLVYEKNSKGNTPLHVAVRWAGASSIDVEAGGQQLLSMVNEDGDTALQVAVRYDNDDEFEIVRELMKEDPKLAIRVNNAGESALFLAVDGGNYKMARHILSAAPDDCSYAGRHGMNVLHALLLHKSGYFVKEVMEKCSSTTIKQGDDSGWTPLHVAAHMGNRKFVKLLLEKDYSPAYLRNKDGLSAFHIAAKEGNVQVMKQLIEKCPDIFELLDDKGRTALHVAAESGMYKSFNFLVRRPEFKGFFDEQDKEGNTFVHLAAIKDQLEIGRRFGHPTRLSRSSMHNRSSDVETWDRWGYTIHQVSETNMFIATLIATVTFTAAFTVPGGFNQNGNVGEGLAVLSKVTAFHVFLIANTLAFGLSITTFVVRFVDSTEKWIEEAIYHREMVRRTAFYMNWSILALLVAFIAGTYAVVPHSLGIAVVVIICCCFLSPACLLHFFSAYYWIQMSQN
ncbi:hypothetical protein RGQ29_013814 [Quercus rubra]|uniref:PGG domain-containing protein n=1 Tax=Quercus rubra TaxID=3512 RepID=A0AAN7FRH9_QUERU|nr:hypothetical protein RGQ29_013814 [Quercus rubra]